MKVKFELAENVIMTNYGLKKVCISCGGVKEMWEFPFNKRKVFMRYDACNECSRGGRKTSMSLGK